MLTAQEEMYEVLVKIAIYFAKICTTILSGIFRALGQMQVKWQTFEETNVW